jgi:hypothetical protein
MFFKDIDWEALTLKKIDPPFKPKLKGDKDLKYFDMVIFSFKIYSLKFINFIKLFFINKMFLKETVKDTPLSPKGFKVDDKT